MAEKESFLLNDKDIIPTDDFIFLLIGEKKILWKSIMDYVSVNYNEVSGSWNYYNDGKQWLFKMVHKKKTIFWSGILKDTFRITFWFGDKAESMIDDSDLPSTIKNEFKTAKKYGSIRGISIKVNDTDDVENVRKLIGIKYSIK